MRLAVLLFSLTLIACAEDKKDEFCGQGSGTFRNWCAPSGETVPLAGGHFGTNDVVLSSAGGSCQCKLQFDGWHEQGIAEIKFCTADGFNTSPSCTALEERYNYEATASSLELCPMSGGACTVYY